MHLLWVARHRHIEEYCIASKIAGKDASTLLMPERVYVSISVIFFSEITKTELPVT